MAEQVEAMTAGRPHELARSAPQSVPQSGRNAIIAVDLWIVSWR
jgi:hypothetical protein